jgi:hypothetical protein
VTDRQFGAPESPGGDVRGGPLPHASEQRARNLRTGLTLAAIAAGFFVAVILRHVYLA